MCWCQMYLSIFLCESVNMLISSGSVWPLEGDSTPQFSGINSLQPNLIIASLTFGNSWQSFFPMYTSSVTQCCSPTSSTPTHPDRCCRDIYTQYGGSHCTQMMGTSPALLRSTGQTQVDCVRLVLVPGQPANKDHRWFVTFMHLEHEERLQAPD